METINERIEKLNLKETLQILSEGEGINTKIFKETLQLHGITELQIEANPYEPVKINLKMIKTKFYWRNNRWEAELGEKTYHGVVPVFTAKLFVSPETLKEMEKNSRRFQIDSMRTVWEDVPE